VSGPDVRAIRTESLPEAPFPPVRQEFRIVLAEEAFDRAVARGAEEPDREIGGILVGKLCRDAGGAYVRVDTTIDALHAEEKGTELTFTHETWSHVHEVMDRDHPDLQIVGWYHTHPGFGVFLSDRDVFIHRSFFDLPHQIALVHDPRSREHGVFAWRDGEPQRCRRYWIGEAEQTWEPPAAPEVGRREEEDGRTISAPATPSSSAALPPLDRVTMAIAAVVLLALGGAGGWWIAGRPASEDPERLRTQLLAERLAGARDVVEKLDADLLDLLGRAIDGETLSRMEEALGVLDRGLAPLTGETAPDEETRAKAIEDLRQARQRLRALQDTRLGAARLLATLQRARSELGDPREIRTDLALHRAVLGRLCAEMARQAVGTGAPDRARSLLQLAIRVDPGNREAYETELGKLGDDR
jgi:proteasome lid subunit RPN8/RPN11